MTYTPKPGDRAYTDDDVTAAEEGHHAWADTAVTVNWSRLHRSEYEAIVAAVAPQIAARAVAKYREALGPVPTLRTPDVEVGSDHGDAH